MKNPWKESSLPLIGLLTLLVPAMASPDPKASGDLAKNSPSEASPVSQKERELASQAERSFREGRPDESERLYREALDINPRNAPLLVSLAAIETRLGRSGESRRLLERALSLDLKNGPAWLLLGMNELGQRNDKAALADLAQAEACDPQNPRVHNYLGIAAGRRGWTEASEEELRKAAELDPNYANANFNLAVLYLNRTPPLLEMARRHYLRAVDLGSPKDPLIEKRLANPVPPDSQPLPATPFLP